MSKQIKIRKANSRFTTFLTKRKVLSRFSVFLTKYISYGLPKYRTGKTLTLSKTNMLRNNNKEYVSHFSMTSFIKTLRKLIHSGEYNKTKKG